MSDQRPRSDPPLSGWALGGVAFAACILTLIGSFQIISGLAAIFDDDFFVVANNYAFDIDTSAWGWVHLLLGVLMLATGIGLFSRADVGRRHRDLPRDAQRDRQLLLHPLLPVLVDPRDRARCLGDLGADPARRARHLTRGARRRAGEPPAQRVALYVPARTLLVLLGFGSSSCSRRLVRHAAVDLAGDRLALGLDPIVGALVRRGWGRGRASLVVFAGLFASVLALVLLSVGPVWSEVEEFIRELPGLLGRADVQARLPGHHRHRRHRRHRANALQRAGGRAAGGGQRAARHRRRDLRGVLSLVTLTFLSLFLLMERPNISDVAVRLHPARRSSALVGR